MPIPMFLNLHFTKFSAKVLKKYCKTQKGFFIVSTSKGILTLKKAAQSNLGGFILFKLV